MIQHCQMMRFLFERRTRPVTTMSPELRDRIKSFMEGLKEPGQIEELNQILQLVIRDFSEGLIKNQEDKPDALP